MLTWEEDVEVHALRKRGWTISAIARHTKRDRKTVRAYLNGTSTPGVRKRSAARQPQRRGGEVQSHCRPTLVADTARRCDC